MHPLRHRAPFAGLVAAVAAGLALSGCSVLGGGPSAEDEAAALAAAVGRGDLSTLAYDGGTPAQAQRLWRSTVAGLEGATPRVTVGKVADDDDRATATLDYSWTLPGTSKRWTYTTTAALRRDADDDWRVRLAPTLVHPRLAAGERLAQDRTAARRADILGAGGARLVTARTVFRFGVDKTRTPAARQPGAARALARALDVDAPAYVAAVRAAGPRAFVEALVLRPADAQTALDAGVGAISGVSVVRDTLPLAPTRDFARAVLGTVGPVTAELVKASKGGLRAGDEAGLSGLEGRYDEQLRGTPGVTVRALSATGAARDLFTVPPVPGRPLATTLSPRLQQDAEAALSDVRPASALVAIRPSTGALLAVASGPGSDGYSTATVGQYAPGSTFKVVSSLALLRAGLTPDSPVDCPATTFVTGKRFTNYSDYPADGLGRITLATAVANSCNTAFVGQRSRVSQADLARAAASLGLGVDHDLGFPVFLGSVPATERQAGSETGHAASMIGQGRVVASPLSMAAVAASVARGRTVVPRLLPQQQPDAVAAPRPVTAGEARQLRSLMRGVVTRGSASFLGSLPGPPVLAKTGTAEFGATLPLRTHAWMIAVHGDLAVAVFVDVGTSGSGTAGPVLERFLRAAG